MVYKLEYTKRSLKDLDRLGPDVARRILSKLDFIIKEEDPLSHSKKLKGFDIATYRFRVGDYRVVFRKDEKSGKLVVLVVLRVAHRKEVYK